MPTLFSTATFDFLEQLAANNDRAWFEANKSRYEECVREPALAFIAAMAPELAKLAPHFRADARKMGGSLMRVYRDTRFARNKTPYKTNVGIQFRHELGKDVHAPGFYVHVAVDECFLGVGCWHPEPEILGNIRARIAEKTEAWLAVRDAPAFAANWELDGDVLSRPPRGYAPDHPAIADLKRKDFIALMRLAPQQVTAPDLVEQVSASFATALPFMRFLCQAVGVAF